MFVAVTVTAWLGGRGPALLAMVLGYVAAHYFFATSPNGPQTTLSPFATLPVYLGVCLVIIFSFEEMRKARGRAEDSMREAQAKERALREEISHRRGIEEALKESESRYRRLIETTHEGVWTIDADGKTDYVNARACEILGYAAEEMMGRAPMEFVLEEDASRLAEELKGRQEGEPARHDEFRMRHKQGSELYIHCSSSALLDAHGKCVGTLLMFADVTHRKKWEMELRDVIGELAVAKEALEQRVKERTATLANTVGELEAFSYSLSHDMRAPLRTIYSFAQHVNTEYGEKLGSSGSEFLRRIIAAAERMDRLIQDVLSFTRISRQEIQVAAVDTGKLVRDILSERPELQAPSAEIIVPNPLLPMRGHEASLIQALTNLLSNAVKFVGKGVKPQVHVWSELVGPSSGAPARAAVDGAVTPHAGQDCQVRLWIEDNGIGIKPEERERIFGLFYRLHRQEVYDGTGIGLAIVRKAAERMGGDAGVESEPGRGSRFWLQLPLGELEEAGLEIPNGERRLLGDSSKREESRNVASKV